MSRLLYSALLYILLPFTAIKLLWRGVRQPAYLNHWSERYGFTAKQSRNHLFGFTAYQSAKRAPPSL